MTTEHCIPFMDDATDKLNRFSVTDFLVLRFTAFLLIMIIRRTGSGVEQADLAHVFKAIPQGPEHATRIMQKTPNIRTLTSLSQSSPPSTLNLTHRFLYLTHR